MSKEFKGKLFVFSAPSGSGKTTIVRHLLKQNRFGLEFSISATSREPRSNEVDGEDYYFISAKDLALADALIKDGFSIPSNFKYTELSQKFDIPKNLLQLIDNDQKAFLALKIVEIIGEDEPYQLDPETIYFVTSLLNKMNLVTIRNKVLNSALPLRT